MSYETYSLVHDIVERIGQVGGDEWNEAVNSLNDALNRDEMWDDDQKDLMVKWLLDQVDAAYDHFVEYDPEELEDALHDLHEIIHEHKPDEAALALLPDWVKADPGPRRDRVLEALTELLRPIVEFGAQADVEHELSKLAEQCRRIVRGY